MTEPATAGSSPAPRSASRVYETSAASRATLSSPPPAPEIFAHIAEAGGIAPATMYATFNMGTGFCVVVAPADAEAALAALAGAGEQPVLAGSVTGRPGRYVSIPQAGLLGRGDVFEVVRDTV